MDPDTIKKHPGITRKGYIYLVTLKPHFYMQTLENTLVYEHLRWVKEYL